MLSDEDKIACIDKQLEMNQRANEFWLFRNSHYGDMAWRCQVKMACGDDKVEITVDGKTLEAVIEEAHTRFTRYLGKLPEFDANKSIEHKPINPDDEMPF